MSYNIAISQDFIMLQHLSIRDYAIVDHLEVDFGAGMTVITGETGAGKSIMLDALGLCLGDRADSRTVRPGANRAEISASFNLDAQPEALAWLVERELDRAEGDCLLRRTVTAEGRSRAFINGVPATLVDCAELGALLVDIHSQHAHQSLLRKSAQADLLDAYAGSTALARDVANSAHHVQALLAERDQLSGQSAELTARRDLLRYQTGELEHLGLTEGEIERLETDQKMLTNAEFLLQSAGHSAEDCERLAEQVSRLAQLFQDPRHDERRTQNIRELLSSAEIQLAEAHSDLQRYSESVELDPARLTEVNHRLEAIHDLARKHRVPPAALTDHLQAMLEELGALEGNDDRLVAIEQDLKNAQSAYQKLASELSAARRKAGKSLRKAVHEVLGQLAMGNCELQIELTATAENVCSPRGLETVEFLVSTNPGSAPGPLNKIASGGELSRLSLALQVAAADNATVPTMVFDEVDVGVGGAVAEVVGDLLRKLSQQVQVMCVTHLPQVAAKGHQHFQVSKAGTKTTAVALAVMDTESRVDELARMLGGVKITDSTVAHARELLEMAS